MTMPSIGKPITQKFDGVAASTRVQLPGTKINLSKSAARALDVLEYFALVGRPLRAIDISHAFGFHPSSTDQLLKTMVDSAYLVVEPQGKLYYPSPRLVKFGSWLAASYYGEDRICRLLRSVYTASEETVTLAVRHSGSMQLVDVLEPPSSAGMVLKGLRVPIIGSAIGGAFLAAHSDSEIRRIVLQISGHKDKTANQLDTVMDDIRKVRTSGYALGGLDNGGGHWSIALPLPKPSSGVAMVIGVAGQRERMQARETDLVDLVRQNIDRWLR